MGVPASPESVSENTAEEPAQSAGGPMPPKKQRFRRPRRILLLRGVHAVLTLPTAFFAWLCRSIGSALAAPGDEGVVARRAEWARDHRLGPVVTSLEDRQNEAHPPRIGGRPGMAPAPDGGPAHHTTSNRPALKPITPAQPITPARLVSPAGAPLPGEGAWQTLVDGTPALFGALVRPDNAHTSYLAAVVSMDERLVRFPLHPGQSDYRPQPNPADPTPVELLPEQERPAVRYDEDTSRDRTAVCAR
ncbi:hypothetical protein [Streptacidiphilus neutrinimicus]|uniref:hypothetical protein n=1 Tax=Streptacidiphilus neutrinimicus TaxID=105420 RepID=UPI0006949FD2|nr:hypothetical protein [Streptacidiphilus neutrinimicus]